MNNPMLEVLRSINGQLSCAIGKCVTEVWSVNFELEYEGEYEFYYGFSEFADYTHGRNSEPWTIARAKSLALKKERNPYVGCLGRRYAELSEHERKVKSAEWELQHEMALNNALLEELHSLSAILSMSE